MGCWSTAALLAIVSAVAAVIFSAGDIPATARLIDGASLIENGGGAVEGGIVDVVLEDVPFAVSWPYILVVVAGVIAWSVLCVSLARISRGLRAGVPFRSVTPGFLYGLTAVWTGIALASPFVISATQPAMAEAAGVSIPGATFSYTMAGADLASVIIGPVVAVVVAVLATGSRMWSQHRVRT